MSHHKVCECLKTHIELSVLRSVRPVVLCPDPEREGSGDMEHFLGCADSAVMSPVPRTMLFLEDFMLNKECLQ